MSICLTITTPLGDIPCYPYTFPSKVVSELPNISQVGELHPLGPFEQPVAKHPSAPNTDQPQVHVLLAMPTLLLPLAKPRPGCVVVYLKLAWAYYQPVTLIHT